MSSKNQLNNEKKDVQLELSLDQKASEIMSKLQKELINDELEKFPDIKENDINISTSYIFDLGDKLEASIFFRNGLKKKINFDKIPISIIDSNENVLASQIFDLREIGDIPPLSARPWKLLFDKENVFAEEVSKDNCKIVFGGNIQALKTVKVAYENAPDNLAVSLKNKLNEYLENLPLLKRGDISLNTYDIKIEVDNKIYIAIVIRNGHNKKIKVEKLPLTLYDADNKIIWSDILNIESLEVSSLKAKIFNIVVNTDKLDLSQYNLEKLSVKFANNKIN
ncbi:SLAP domain-containing protein [Clostridium ganghwense]|uniref:SLAP domain-containing protein n=1 Tax=Clostridium ganghwense TaxID=312089 RepID=A0ABT4CPK8_9CLOT|nr:SLAP domain-containing protein [Clostridium ganghwense]MCY6370987.1 SLAP domain-containing protein [Clostridium ganghwense]